MKTRNAFCPWVLIYLDDVLEYQCDAGRDVDVFCSHTKDEAVCMCRHVHSAPPSCSNNSRRSDAAYGICSIRLSDFGGRPHRFCVLTRQHLAKALRSERVKQAKKKIVLSLSFTDPRSAECSQSSLSHMKNRSRGPSQFGCLCTSSNAVSGRPVV